MGWNAEEEGRREGRMRKVMVSREESRFFDGSCDFELSWIELT